MYVVRAPVSGGVILTASKLRTTGLQPLHFMKYWSLDPLVMNEVGMDGWHTSERLGTVCG